MGKFDQVFEQLETADLSHQTTQEHHHTFLMAHHVRNQSIPINKRISNKSAIARNAELYYQMSHDSCIHKFFAIHHRSLST